MKEIETVGPKNYARYVRIAERVLRCLPALCFTGLIGFVFIIFAADDNRSMQSRFAQVFALTMMPAVLGWVALNGFALVWRIMLGAWFQKKPTMSLVILGAV